MLASPCPCRVTLDSDLSSSHLSFSICKMVIMTVSTCSGNKVCETFSVEPGHSQSVRMPVAALLIFL